MAYRGSAPITTKFSIRRADEDTRNGAPDLNQLGAMAESNSPAMWGALAHNMAGNDWKDLFNSGVDPSLKFSKVESGLKNNRHFAGELLMQYRHLLATDQHGQIAKATSGPTPREIGAQESSVEAGVGLLIGAEMAGARLLENIGKMHPAQRANLPPWVKQGAGHIMKNGPLSFPDAIRTNRYPVDIRNRYPVDKGGKPPRKGSRASGTNPRAMGTNPRKMGTNPRKMGTNPRANKYPVDKGMSKGAGYRANKYPVDKGMSKDYRVQKYPEYWKKIVEDYNKKPVTGPKNKDLIKHLKDAQANTPEHLRIRRFKPTDGVKFSSNFKEIRIPITKTAFWKAATRLATKVAIPVEVAMMYLQDKEDWDYLTGTDPFDPGEDVRSSVPRQWQSRATDEVKQGMAKAAARQNKYNRQIIEQAKRELEKTKSEK